MGYFMMHLKRIVILSKAQGEDLPYSNLTLVLPSGTGISPGRVQFQLGILKVAHSGSSQRGCHSGLLGGVRPKILEVCFFTPMSSNILVLTCPSLF